MEWQVVNLDSETVGTVDLADGVFAAEVRPDLMARYVNWQLAKRRAGTHKVKTRSEVNRTGKKPFKQKGGGRARQGSTKGPQMRGGAVVLGPLPRDHSHDLPKKVRRLALRSALSAKLAGGGLVVLDKAELDAPKTALLAERAAKFGWHRALIIDARSGGHQLRARRPQPRRHRRDALGRRQRLRHPAARNPGADPGGGRQTGGAAGMKAHSGAKARVLSSERLYEVIRRPVITEKATMLSEYNQVTFLVAPDASKPEIKTAVERLFKVKVTAVNTLIQQGQGKAVSRTPRAARRQQESHRHAGRGFLDRRDDGSVTGR